MLISITFPQILTVYLYCYAPKSFQSIFADAPFKNWSIPHSMLQVYFSSSICREDGDTPAKYNGNWMSLALYEIFARHSPRNFWAQLASEVDAFSGPNIWNIGGVFAWSETQSPGIQHTESKSSYKRTNAPKNIKLFTGIANGTVTLPLRGTADIGLWPQGCDKSECKGPRKTNMERDWRKPATCCRGSWASEDMEMSPTRLPKDRWCMWAYGMPSYIVIAAPEAHYYTASSKLH